MGSWYISDSARRVAEISQNRANYYINYDATFCSLSREQLVACNEVKCLPCVASCFISWLFFLIENENIQDEKSGSRCKSTITSPPPLVLGPYSISSCRGPEKHPLTMKPHPWWCIATYPGAFRPLFNFVIAFLISSRVLRSFLMFSSSLQWLYLWLVERLLIQTAPSTGASLLPQS